MYGLDVNFLKDRPEYNKSNTATRTKQRVAANPGDRRPLIFGAIAGVAFPAIALGLLLFLQKQNGDLEQEQASLDAQLSTIEARRKEIGNVRAETKRAQDETQALAGVFNTVKPLSSLMQEIRDRTPTGVQLTSIKQLPVVPAASQPANANNANSSSTLPPSGNIVIGGIAKSFNDVNDLMLGLQQSRFFDARATRLKTSQLKEGAKLTLP
ncbi:MAG TPA: PilN domain-containing protein, partial [Thermosynechococcaceae cyanobacterium]